MGMKDLQPLLTNAIDPLVERRVYAQEADGHRHDYCQLLLGLRGSAALEMHGRQFLASVLHGVIVPADCRHEFAGQGDNCQLVVDMPVASVAVPAALFRRPRAFAITPALRGWLDKLPHGPALRQRQYDWQLAVGLAGAVSQSLGGDVGEGCGFPVAQIDAYLRRRLEHPIATAELAAHFGWGVRRFHDLFCEAFGDTPHQYHNRLKLDAAVGLLARQGLPLAEIGQRLGYGDQPAFTRRFSQRFGMPPGQWRREADSSAAMQGL